MPQEGEVYLKPAKKFEWGDDLPIRGVENFTYNDLKDWWLWLDASLRLGEFYRLRVVDEWIEQTKVYQDGFSNHPYHKQVKTIFESAMQEAYNLGLISLKTFYESKDYKSGVGIGVPWIEKQKFSTVGEQKEDALPDEISEKDYNEFWYIRHITKFMNLAGYAALYHVWDHSRGNGHELQTNQVRNRHRRAMPSGSKKRLKQLKIHATTPGEAFTWFEYIWRFFKVNHDYLPKLVASVNVMSGTISDSCKLSRGELVKKVNRSKAPENLEPDVISLWSRYKYLNEPYDIAVSEDFREAETLAIRKKVKARQFFGTVTIDSIITPVGKATYYVGKTEEWRQMFETFKPHISKPEAILWERRFKELKVLEYACQYWSKRLHAICLPDKKVDKEEEAQKVDDLIEGVDKFDTYNKANVLKSIRFFYDKLKDTEVKDGKGLGTLEDFENDEDQKKITSEKKQDALTDDEKLIVESLESFRKAFNDTGVHLKHLAFFYGETTKKTVKEWGIASKADVANKYNPNATHEGSRYFKETKIDVPVDTDRLIPTLFHTDHDDIEYSPIYAHPVFQDFLDLFPKHRKQWEEKPNVKVTWEENRKKMSKTKKLKMKKGGKGQTGEPSIKIARWMLKNLPTPTERMLKDLREQSVVDQSLEA
jgi:hypothetical protein